MKIEPGKYFEIAYKLYRINQDGSEELVHEVTADDPDRVIDGVTIGLVEALDKDLAGKEAGYKFNLTAMPEEAFGPYSQDEIYRIPRERMTVDGKFDEEMFAPGEIVPLRTPDGFRIDGVVLELTPRRCCNRPQPPTGTGQGTFRRRSTRSARPDRRRTPPQTRLLLWRW